MPHYSFSTVLMTLLASNMMICFTALILHHKNAMIQAGYKLLIFCMGLMLLRFILPFEFPFTSNILLPGVPAAIIIFFRQPMIFVGGIEISVWTLFELVWTVGIVFHIVRYRNNRRSSMNFILKYGDDKTNEPKYQEILTQLCTQYGRKNNFHVIESSCLNVPIIFGLRTPCIVLPRQLPLSSDQLYYVLCHETLHYFHHDLLLKSVIRILSIIYWWNPVCILMQKQANVLLEMRIDGKVTQGKCDIINDYTACLLYIRKYSVECAAQVPSFLNKDALFLLPQQKTDLQKRFDMMMKSSSPRKKLSVSVLLTVLAAGIYLTSYLYILEADYYPPNLEELGLEAASPENTHFIKIGDFDYKVFFYDIYTETITSLKYYPKGIKIYNEEGVLIDET